MEYISVFYKIDSKGNQDLDIILDPKGNLIFLSGLNTILIQQKLDPIILKNWVNDYTLCSKIEEITRMSDDIDFGESIKPETNTKYRVLTYNVKKIFKKDIKNEYNGSLE